MKKIVFIMLVAVIGTNAFSVRVSFSEQTKYEYADDSVITMKVKDIIVQDLDSAYLKIDVDTTGGNVVLMGSVNSKATEKRLESKIKQLKGVKSVRSLLKVKEK